MRAIKAVADGKDMTQDIIQAIMEKEQFLHRVQLIAGLGTYVTKLDTGCYTSSLVLDEVFGISPDYPHTNAGWEALIHPDDRAMITSYFKNEVLGLRRRFDKEYRIIRVADGAERWVHGCGELEFDEAGVPVIMTGTIQDVTERKRSEKALQQSETRYRELIDLAVDGILVGSSEGIITDANRRMCEMTGLRRDELVGKRIDGSIFTPESLASHPLRFDLMQKGEIVVRERQLFHTDGALVHIEMRSKMMPDGSYQGIFRDITERKTTEASLLHFTKVLAHRVEERTRELETANATLKQSLHQLQSSQALLSEMGRMAKVGGWELDLHTGKQTWTKEVYHLHEVGPTFEPTAENGITFYSDEARPVVAAAVQRCIEQGEPFDLEVQFITAKGKCKWVRAVGKADLKHAKIQGTIQDVTARREADDALREKNAALDLSVAQLRKLAMELTQAEEVERKRLASILHDNVQQYIAAANMKISLLDTQMSADEHARGVKSVLAVLGEAMAASRSLTVSLCPPVLLEAGLMPGLRWLAEWMKDQHGLAVKVTGDVAQVVPGSLNTLLFQAVRELLFNVVKHAGVKQASVVLDQPDEKSIRLTVVDQGKGFPASESHFPPLSGGFGLFHLRERLAYIGGAFDVVSVLAQGTRVSITIPLSIAK